MAVEIKSGSGTDLLTVDPLSKSMRVTNYNSDGVEGFQSLPLALNVANVSAVNNDLLSSFDVEKFKFVSFQLSGIWVGAVSFQGSNDNGTFYPIATSDPSGGVSSGNILATVNRLVKIPTTFKYLRVRVTAYTSGTVEGIAYGHRDENSSGLIASLGPVTLEPETTKKIGNVGLEAGTNTIGAVTIIPTPSALLTDYYVGQSGEVDINSRVLRGQGSTLRAIVMTNLAATPRYVKIYDQATVPVAGTGTPVIVIALPAAATLAYPIPVEGLQFANGIAMTMTLGAANSDTTTTATVDFLLTSIFT
tara:strand:- start:4151 stop:5065 length:915 start_codon:yes stop_codon:yes gene_type:complete